jgi:hypothetical protein
MLQPNTKNFATHFSLGKTMNEFIEQKLCMMIKPFSRCLGILGYVGEEQSAGIDD